jgi:glucoamylase
VPYANGSVYAHADYSLEPLIREYVSSQGALQLLETPSGSLLDGGLGEPKYKVDGTAFTGSWGRPQRVRSTGSILQRAVLTFAVWCLQDGPPLRALVVARYADFLLKRGEPLDGEYVRANLYNPSKLISRGALSFLLYGRNKEDHLLSEVPFRAGSILKSDLEYVAHNWNKTSFDLWYVSAHDFSFTRFRSLTLLTLALHVCREEINGHHFFTLLSSYRALKHGAALALDMDDPLASDFYQKQADSIALKLESFWLSDDGYVTATLDAGSFGRSGLDAAVLLAVLHVGGKDDEPWSATDDRVLATIVRFVQSFEHGLYAINEGEGRKGWKGAIAVGRYMEDVYDGDGKSKANPWFIATYGVSQILYRCVLLALHRSLRFTALKRWF